MQLDANINRINEIALDAVREEKESEISLARARNARREVIEYIQKLATTAGCKTHLSDRQLIITF